MTERGTMTVQYPSDLGTCETPVELDGTTDVVKVEHLAPAEWPPRSGDIWRDRARVLWFARDHYDVVGAEPMRTMAPLVTGPYGLDELTPDDLMEAFGPLTLVHRKEGELLDEVDALRDVIANLEGEVDHHSSAAEALRQQVAALTAERDRLAEQAAEGEARLHAALVDLEGVNLNALTVDELHQMLTTAMRGPAGGA